MIQIHAWQVDFHLGKLDLGLLIQMDKLKGILKLYTVTDITRSLTHGLLVILKKRKKFVRSNQHNFQANNQNDKSTTISLFIKRLLYFKQIAL